MSDNRKPLAGKTLFIAGPSRDIGPAIALRTAGEGANVAIAAGGHALPLVMELRDWEVPVMRPPLDPVVRKPAIAVSTAPAPLLHSTPNHHHDLPSCLRA